MKRALSSAPRGRSRFSIECHDGNYEGTITADFREYIFDGTIKWPLNYEGSAEKRGVEGSGSRGTHGILLRRN